MLSEILITLYYLIHALMLTLIFAVELSSSNSHPNNKSASLYASHIIHIQTDYMGKSCSLFVWVVILLERGMFLGSDINFQDVVICKPYRAIQNAIAGDHTGINPQSKRPTLNFGTQTREATLNTEMTQKAEQSI